MSETRAAKINDVARESFVHSYYSDSALVELIADEPLRGNQRADVCVVGGGVTGCSTALHLAERGYQVRLVEARRIGWGASGRSGGQVLPGFGVDMEPISAAVGLEAARALWDMSREAVTLTEERVRRHAIPCDLKHGAVHAAIKKRHLREFRRWQAGMAETYGYEGLQWLDRAALQARVNTDAYLGGLYEPEGVHLHPLNYTLGLALAARQTGVTLHEASAVTRIEHGHPARVHTDAGTVEAEFVVLAGNAYLSGLEPALHNKIMPVGNYIVATEPLTEAQIAATLPQDDAVSDANFVLDYYRLSGDRRLIYGGLVSYNGREPRKLQERMAAKLTRLFPALRGIAIPYQWGGWVGITLNRAPHFGRIGNNVYFAQGYSGQGLALAGLAGKLLAEAIDGEPERFDLFARLPHRRFPGGARLRTPLLVLATNFYRMRDLL